MSNANTSYDIQYREDSALRFKHAAEALVVGDPKDPATQFSAALASAGKRSPAKPARNI